MDTGILEEFVVLAGSCSFQETAARLHISQSSLSKHIRKLEEELGVSLFDRSTRSVTLSAFGRALCPRAQTIIAEKDAALAELRHLTAMDRRTVTVSYAPVLGQYGLIETLSAFSRSHPELALRTLENYRPAALLKAGGCDFAFEEGGSVYDGEFCRSVYCTDHLCAVLPSGHPLAALEKVTLDQLRGERFILHTRQGGPPHEETERFLELCRDSGFVPEVAAEAEYTSSILRYVNGGRGIAVLNRLHLPVGVGSVAVVDFDPPVLSHIYLLYPKKLPSSAAEEFLDFITREKAQ